MSPMVSVLLPAYGEAPYITHTLNSIYEQSYEDFEILLLYSNPQPATMSILNHFKSKKGKLTIFEFEKNVNLGAALNFGLAHSNSPYISRIDSDDLMISNRLHKQVEYLKGHSDVVLVGAQKIHIDQLNQIIHLPPAHPQSSFIINLLLKNGYCPIVHPSTMFRRESALIAGGYSEEMEYAEDFEFWTRLAQVGKFRNLTDVFVAYRIHNQNKSQNDPTNRFSLKNLLAKNYRSELGVAYVYIKFTDVVLLYLYLTYESIVKTHILKSIKKFRKTKVESAAREYLLHFNQIHL